MENKETKRTANFSAKMCIRDSGLTGGDAVGFSNYTKNGGLFPMGIAGIGAVILTSFYALSLIHI